MKSLLILLAAAVFVAPVSLVCAQGGSGSFPGGSGGYTGGSGGYTGGSGSFVELNNPLKEDTIQGFFETLLDAIFVIALPFFVLMMAFVGFLFVKARGNPEQLGKAKQAFLYTIVGTGVFFGAWVLVKMLKSLMDALAS